MQSSTGQIVRVAANAMATRFECVLRGSDTRRLHSIGEQAMIEVKSAEKRLNFYDPDSELSRINRTAGRGPVNVAPDLFDLLTLCKRVYSRTSGAFDPTVAALMSVWGFAGDSGRIPESDVLQEAVDSTGMNHVRLGSDRTVRFDNPKIALDLGGVGKGWALDTVRQLFLDHGLENALIHGGTSTVVALGCDEAESGWTIGLADPWAVASNAWFDRVSLRNQSLSVSSVAGKSFIHGDVEYGHVIDPRSGLAVRGRAVAACIGESAAVTDAVSTAMLFLEDDEVPAEPERCARFVRRTGRWSLDAGRWIDPDATDVQ